MPIASHLHALCELAHHFEPLQVTEPRNCSLHVGDTTISLSVGPGRSAHIISLRTRHKRLRNGSARRAMEQLCLAADRAGFELSIWASPLNKRTNLARLVRFYQSLGFRLTGKIINQAGEPELIRPCLRREIRKIAPSPEMR